MTTDTKAKLTSGAATIGAAAVGAATMGWKAAVIAGAGAFFSFLGGLFHSTPGAK